MASLASVAMLVVASVCLSGCANLGYYWQSVGGHLQVINRARSVQEWLDDEKTPEVTKKKLALSQRIRAFASTELALPNNASYRRYADLQRRAVVWNVVAAPEFSLKPKTWCFPVAGCVGYRGYYAEADANALAATLKAEGLEVSVYGVPAYSTLGYLNWAGGDPLLSTFINYPEGELARLVFHELAHQVLYVQDDTMFNESFATAVERIGGRLWLQQHGSPAAQAEYAAFDARRQAFRALTLATRAKLEKIYANVSVKGSKLAMKNEVMEVFKQNYQSLKTSWNGYAGYDPWVARANNASFGAQAAYDELVPQFETVFERQGRDFAKFYAAIQDTTSLPREARRAALATLARP